jgi:serine/threonine protein kinase
MLVLEYAELGDLRSYLKSKKHRVTLVQLLAIFHGVARGMAHLHLPQLSLSGMKRSACAHRDLKPENVMLTASKVARAWLGSDQCGVVPKIGDFGVAKPALGCAQVGVGTPHFMAPEILVQEKSRSSSREPGTSRSSSWLSSNPRNPLFELPSTMVTASLENADLYSFGCLMWSCLMPGCPAPFENDVSSFDDLCRLVTSGKRPIIPATFSHNLASNEWALPKALRHLVKSCWHGQPGHRLDGKGFAGAVKLLEAMVQMETASAAE